MKGKPTLLQLREKYGVGTVPLARAARVAPDIVYFMLVGIPVERVEAEKVLQGFKALAGVEYELEEITVVLKSSEPL